MNVLQIPFDNDFFYNGIQKMQEYYLINRYTLGIYEDELSMLFIKRPFDGLFSEFKRVISTHNGWYLNLINPDYVIATIKITEKDAEYTLRQEELSIDRNYLFGFARAFCEGAGVKFSPECEVNYANC